MDHSPSSSPSSSTDSWDDMTPQQILREDYYLLILDAEDAYYEVIEKYQKDPLRIRTNAYRIAYFRYIDELTKFSMECTVAT